MQHREELLAKAKAEAKTLRMAADQKQLQLKSGEDKVKDLRRKLNAATSNREYQALLEQIAADEMTNSVLADEILEALEKVDAFQKNIAEAEAALAAAKQKAGRSPRRGGPAGAACWRPTSPGWRPSCSSPRRPCPAEIREMYRRIVRQKGEDALAMVENQCCGGCNQQIPLNMLQSDHARPAGLLQDLRPAAVSAGVGAYLPIPKGLNMKARGCRAAATPGGRSGSIFQP